MRIVAAVLLVLCLPFDAFARDVYVGVYLHDLTRFRLKDGMVDVDFDLWAKWRGELREGGVLAPGEFDPEQLQVANAAEIDRQFLGIESDRDWHTARWRVRGTLRGEFPMHRFPYDVQTVAVSVELPDQFGTVVADAAGSGVAEHFSLTDWLYDAEFHVRSQKHTVASDLGLLEREGLPSTLHRVDYQVRLRRPILTVALKMFLPLGIIVLVAVVALFLPAGATIGPRSSIGVTALLSCFAFQFTIADNLPSVAYLTLADILFLIAYVSSSAALVTTIFSHGLMRKGLEDRSLRLDRIARLGLPLCAVIAVVIAVPADVPDPELVQHDFPRAERHASARDELTIGVASLPRATSGPLLFGTGWGMLVTPPEEDPLPFLVERRPGIDNEAVRFLSDGRLEVTWRLRSGLKWSDGAPVVARDLTLPWEAYANEHVHEVDARNDRTLVVTWKGRLAEALEGPAPWPSHVLESVFEEGGYDAVRDFRRANPTPKMGPYRLVEFEAGERLVAEANEHFTGSPPAIRRIVVRRLEPDALIEAFVRGEVDITGPNAVTLAQAREVERRRPGHARIRPSSAFIFLQPDFSDPQLTHLEFRRALLMGLDRQRMSRNVYADGGRVAHLPVPDLEPHDLVVTPFDPEGARDILARLGAEEATIKFIHGETEVDRQIAAEVVADWTALGLQVESVVVESTARAARDRSHGGLLLHVVRGDREAPPGRYWNLPLEQGSYAYETRHDAFTDEVHALVERERHALYPERRNQLRDALMSLTSERLPNLPLVFAAERILATPELRGWDFGPSVGFGTSMADWYFER